MQLSIRTSPDESAPTPLQRYLAPISALLLLGVFLAIPVSLSAKSHAFLHGICAQRPSHTLQFGDGLLPFDARMTGIYAGFLSTFVLLIMQGRHRNAGLPTLSAGAMLLLLLATMAVDGFNSLFTDVGFATPYRPRNEMRLLTGAAAGVGLATMLCMLLGQTIWRRPRMGQRIVSRWWEPLSLLCGCLPVVAVLLSGWSPLLAPLTLMLVTSAVVAFSGLAMVALLLICGQENRFERIGELQRWIVAGGLTGIAIIGLLAAGRFMFEAWTHVPALT